MDLSGGELCGTKITRHTIIEFECDSTQVTRADSKSHSNQPSETLEFLYEQDCAYYFVLKTRFACIYDCALEYNRGLFDLSGLTKSNGNFWSIMNQDKSMPYSHLILNVCGQIDLTAENSPSNSIIQKIKEKCSREASICAYNSQTDKVTSLGQFTTDLEMFKPEFGLEYLRLVYQDGEICNKAGGNRSRTIINFICDENSSDYPGLDWPKLEHVSSDQCLAEIYWRNKEACAKNRLVSSNECLIVGLNGRILFNLSSLKQEKRFYEAIHNLDLEEDHSETEKYINYQFHVCGSRIEGTELSFRGPNGFEFTRTPNLIYDNQVLYFKVFDSNSILKKSLLMLC